MQNIKRFVMYTLAFVFFIFLTSSFISGEFVNDAYSVDVSGKSLYYAFAGQLTAYIEGDDITTDKTSITKDYSKTYKKGDSGDEIKSYKYILYYLDFLSDEPNSKFDLDTEKAVKEYQSSRSITQTGKLDKLTMETLDDETIEYKKGKSSDDIKKYNYILYYLGYLDEEPGREINAEVKTAILSYQSDKKLTESGTINGETRKSLDDEELTYKKGQSGDVIKDYQKILIKTGYMKGSADKKFDSDMENAVKKYQKAKNLDVTGKLDKNTRDSLDDEE